MAKYLQEL